LNKVADIYLCLINLLSISHNTYTIAIPYSIKGIGPKKALAYIKQYHSIENLLKHLDRSKFTIPADWLIGEKPEDVPVPSTPTKGKKKVTKKAAAAAAAAAAAKDSGDESDDANAIDVDSDADEQEDTTATTTDDNSTAAAAATDTEKALVDTVDTADEQAPAATVSSTSTKLQVPMYQEARRLFLQPDVNPPDAYDLKWTDPDEAGLTAFLVEKMQFNVVCCTCTYYIYTLCCVCSYYAQSRVPCN
jgi:5'-3' exonuclease